MNTPNSQTLFAYAARYLLKKDKKTVTWLSRQIGLSQTQVSRMIPSRPDIEPTGSEDARNLIANFFKMYYEDMLSMGRRIFNNEPPELSAVTGDYYQDQVQHLISQNEALKKDINIYQALCNQYQERLNRQNDLICQFSEGVIIHQDGIILDCSPSAIDIFEADSHARLVGYNIRSKQSDKEKYAFEHSLISQDYQSYIYELITLKGNVKKVKVHSHLLTYPDNRLTRLVIIIPVDG